MSNSTKILIGIAAVIVIGGLWFYSTYNKLVTMDEQVKGQWAQVESQLKRRYDLIPNLVETVKGYASHESKLFIEIAEARTKYFQAPTTGDKIAASKGLEGALSRLLMLQETYPNLKANESFLKLQDTLEGTENRIAVERKRYNDDARDLNAFRRRMFISMVAGSAGVGEAKYYEVSEPERANPKVKF